MPELELLEAKTLFKHYAMSIGDMKEELNEQLVSRCVELCRFRKGDGISHHYLPLALKVLGNELREQLGCNNFDLRLWDVKLSKIEESYELRETKKQIFSVLRLSYDTLSPEDQMLFMDVALLKLRKGDGILEIVEEFLDSFSTPNLFEWLCLVHGERSQDIMKARVRFCLCLNF